MDIRFTHTNLIFGFEDDGFDAEKIYAEELSDVIKIMHSNNLKIPHDWILVFDIGYNNGKTPLVSKNKVGTYPSDKMKYIKIVVPIPSNKEIIWGVNPEQYLYEKNHYDGLMRNFWELNICFQDFKNRTDYIKACIKAGVKKVFEEGFTVGGEKIKIPTMRHLPTS